jgi:hypothetical protein
MKHIINHTWIPVSGRPNAWHHFIVSRTRPARGKDTVRVAYMRHEDLSDKAVDGRVAHYVAQGSESPIVDAEADRTAERYLSPDAIAAWRAQRSAGWDGTVESVANFV